jgi:hypothetical protein
VVAASADEDERPALVTDTLENAEIVHAVARAAENWDDAVNRATRPPSYACTRGDPRARRGRLRALLFAAPSRSFPASSPTANYAAASGCSKFAVSRRPLTVVAIVALLK